MEEFKCAEYAGKLRLISRSRDSYMSQEDQHKKLQTAIDEVIFMPPQYLLECTSSNSFIRTLPHKKKKKKNQDMYIYEHICIEFMHNHKCSECEDTHSIR